MFGFRSFTGRLSEQVEAGVAAAPGAARPGSGRSGFAAHGAQHHLFGQLAGEQAGLEIHEYPPAEIKKAVVGTGAATKEQVQFMLTRLLKLKSVPQPSDAADGVAA